MSLPFLPDLHSEIERSWDKPYSARIHRYQHINYANIEGMREHGYASMPPIEETLASYLSAGVTSTLKAPALPSKPLRETSRLNGRAYVAAGQADAALHTMSVLQAYQAELLRDLDQGQGISPEAVAELRRATDLALRATKQTAAAIGRSMAAMVATERHLWVNLADIGEKEKRFLLFFLRRLRKFGTSPRILRSFYTCTVESILTGCITAWFGNSTAGNRRALQRVVRTARHIVGGELPSLQDIYTRRCTRKARRIIKDSSHPSHRLLSLLPSGRRFRSIRSRTSRLRDSFFPQAIRLMNSHK